MTWPSTAVSPLFVPVIVRPSVRPILTVWGLCGDCGPCGDSAGVCHNLKLSQLQFRNRLNVFFFILLAGGRIGIDNVIAFFG